MNGCDVCVCVCVCVCVNKIFDTAKLLEVFPEKTLLIAILVISYKFTAAKVRIFLKQQQISRRKVRNINSENM
jgi:hypothetical protein